jgi:hypothetical protein
VRDKVRACGAAGFGETHSFFRRLLLAGRKLRFLLSTLFRPTEITFFIQIKIVVFFKTDGNYLGR